MSDTNSNIFTYGAHSVDFAKLHPAGQRKLIKGGLAHLLGNEASSKVKAAVDRGDIADTDEAKVAFKASIQSGFITALSDGTIGEHSRGPAKDPFEGLVESIARREVMAMLKTNGLKFGKSEKDTNGEAKPRVVTFANGATRTMGEMVAKHLSNNGADGKANADRIKAEAQRELAARDKAEKAAAKRAAEASAKGGNADPDALGL